MRNFLIFLGLALIVPGCGWLIGQAARYYTYPEQESLFVLPAIVAVIIGNHILMLLPFARNIPNDSPSTQRPPDSSP